LHIRVVTFQWLQWKQGSGKSGRQGQGTIHISARLERGVNPRPRHDKPYHAPLKALPKG
jgi:hypothetical protein